MNATKDELRKIDYLVCAIQKRCSKSKFNVPMGGNYYPIPDCRAYFRASVLCEVLDVDIIRRMVYCAKLEQTALVPVAGS